MTRHDPTSTRQELSEKLNLLVHMAAIIDIFWQLHYHQQNNAASFEIIPAYRYEYAVAGNAIDSMWTKHANRMESI